MLNVFHMRCLKRILEITWQDKVTNNAVVEKAGTPKDLLYGELATGKRPTGRPQLRFKDVCKRALQALAINTDSWEVTATDRDAWRHTVKLGLSQ